MQAAAQTGKATTATLPAPSMHVLKHLAYVATPAFAVGMFAKMSVARSVNISGFEETIGGHAAVFDTADLIDDNPCISNPLFLF